MKLHPLALLLTFSLWGWLALNAVAQDAAADESASSAEPPRPIEIADVEDWQRISAFSLSPDGAWCSYRLSPNEGDVTLIIRQVDGDQRHEFIGGSESSSAEFSDDSRWVAFQQAALESEAEAAEKANKRPPTKIVLMRLETGETTEFEGADGFAFSGESSAWIAIEKIDPQNKPTGVDAWDGTDLLLHELSSGTQLNVGNVASYHFNEAGSILAMTIDAQGKLGNGVQLLDTTTRQISVLESDRAVFKSMSWSEEGDGLIFLKEMESEDFENPLHQLIAYRGVGGASPIRLHIDPQQDAGIPNEMTISPNRAPAFSESGDAVLFGIHDAKPKPDEEESDDEEDDAGLVIWHWLDERLQSRQQVQESSDQRFNFLCYRSFDADRSLRLGTEEMRDVTAEAPHRFAIAFDESKYERSGNLDGQRYRDVYVIDLENGRRRMALERARWFFGVSPSGERFLYYEDGHFHAYDMLNGQSRNLTENAPVSFVDEEDDHNVDRPPVRPRGWTKDGDAVVLSDGWDLWRVPVTGGELINLTVNGRTEQIRYQSLYQLDPEQDGFDLSAPNYVSTYGEWTKKAGIGRISSGQPGVESLIWEDSAIGGLSKLEDADVYYYRRETQQQSPEFFVAGPDLSDGRQVTHSNAQQEKFLWSAGVRLVDYQNASGQRLQAALFLPAGYVEGKAYPTVVYIYETLSQRANNYDSPRVGGFSSSIYTSQGFAVLMPDIVYRINDPGVSSVECVVPAVEAAIATGVVDADHIGLHGHSWGGYQTSFLITQTDLFKAAVAGAPLTNMISMYSSIYWNSGGPNQPIFESSQGRFTGGYWTNLEAYARNSPVYHAENVNTPLLLLHNDEDGAVDWNQGIEYFNTLRRLGKSVVMLQYVGENHGLARLENRKDYSYRMLDFFNHYLRGHDAADWWADGISHLEMEEHIRDYRRRQQR